LLQPVVDKHALAIRSLVKNALGLSSDEVVTVEAYDDGITVAGLTPVPPGAATAAASAIANPAALLNAHAKEIALVMMGIVVVLVLSMAFRRPATAGAGAAMMMPTPSTTTGIRPASAAARERHVLLDGVVEDEPAPPPAGPVHLTQEQEAHQLFRRVRDMVSDNPDDAARVLQDWIYDNR
jgi:flagellar biosynthesis/type III secretory pathway M-ring protein FliF/YscJ